MFTPAEQEVVIAFHYLQALEAAGGLAFGLEIGFVGSDALAFVVVEVEAGFGGKSEVESQIEEFFQVEVQAGKAHHAVSAVGIGVAVHRPIWIVEQGRTGIYRVLVKAHAAIAVAPVTAGPHHGKAVHRAVGIKLVEAYRYWFKCKKIDRIVGRTGQIGPVACRLTDIIGTGIEGEKIGEF